MGLTDVNLISQFVDFISEKSGRRKFFFERAGSGQNKKLFTGGAGGKEGDER